jgi:hypothetical protein
MSEKAIRNIISCSLVYVDWKPLVLLDDKKQAEELVKIAVGKGKHAFIKQMTLPEDRKAEIGNNIFKITEKLSEKDIKNILQIRAVLIRESMDVRDHNDVDINIAWGRVSKKYGTPYNTLSWEEFNTWTLDVANFVLIQR